MRELEAGKTLLSQKHYAEDVLRTYDYWDCIPALTPMTPGSRLTKEQCDPNPEPAFHRRYRGIVGSLGYLVNKRGFSTLGKLRETNWKPFEGDKSLSFFFQTKFGVFPVGKSFGI